jgi:hypothetical protein
MAEPVATSSEPIPICAGKARFASEKEALGRLRQIKKPAMAVYRCGVCGGQNWHLTSARQKGGKERRSDF